MYDDTEQEEVRVPEKKITVQMPNVGTVNAFEVGVAESNERWTDIGLEDGTSLRLKSVVPWRCSGRGPL